MTIRESIEIREKEYLSKFATLSMHSKGRLFPEDQCDIRPVFQRDRDRILHCKAFRRLKDKTQVFLSPQGDHYRTRLTHTLEVSQNARTIAKALCLNEDLAEAIALGHDLGHTPFGHAGERALDEVCPFGFEHSIQSVRTVDVLEKDGQGLNLTLEVRDGILNHQTEGMPSTLEGKIVRISDKIAYMHHDCDDAIRAGILTEADVPLNIKKCIGATTRDRLNRFIHDIITTSTQQNDILMSNEVDEAMNELREFMFERVYTNKDAKAEEGKAEMLVKTLYTHYINKQAEIPMELMIRVQNNKEPVERIICDLIAGMTDRYAIAVFEELYVPKAWQ